jgi:Family of unknown function (DUF6390)
LTAVAARPASPGAGAGAVVFARYAVPPNDLGYCGPDDGDGVLAGAAAGVVGPGLRGRARGFDGAWVYLELIAAAVGADPLDARVVEAYWLGTALAERVDPAVFDATVRSRFAGQVGAGWAGLGAAGAAVPHHGFHVFGVYPWLGLLRAGATGPALEVLDRCRISWGRVLARTGDRVQVRSRPLAWTGGQLLLGAPRTRAATGPAGAPGEWVSLHWDRTCEVLGPAALAALRRSTAHQLAVSNRP